MRVQTERYFLRAPFSVGVFTFPKGKEVSMEDGRTFIKPNKYDIVLVPRELVEVRVYETREVSRAPLVEG